MPANYQSPSRESGGQINFSRVVDLSHQIHEGMPQWPGDPAVEFETVADLDRHGFFLRRFSMGEHSGTHLNAPLGFHPDGNLIPGRSQLRVLPPGLWWVSHR